MSISSPARGLSPLPLLELLNPSNPPQPTRVEPSNCMERIVQWLSSDETSLLIKIGAVAMAVIATVGVGILVGYSASHLRNRPHPNNDLGAHCIAQPS